MLIRYILVTLNLLFPTCKVSDSLYAYLLRRESGVFAKIFRESPSAINNSSSNRAMECILNQSFVSHLVYLTWHDAIHGSRAISTKKKCDAVQLDACRNDDSLGKVILDIHRTGNFIRAKLQYRQLSAPDLSAPDKLFRLRGRQYVAANPSVSSTTNSCAFPVSVLNHRNRRASKIVSLVNHRNLTAPARNSSTTIDYL